MSMKQVEVFNCDVKHGNTTQIVHTIPKRGITFREVQLLRSIHGEEAVLNLSPAGERGVDDKEELLRLAQAYADTGEPSSGKKRVEKLFGVSLHNYESWLDQQNEMREMERAERSERLQNEARRIPVAGQAAAHAPTAALARD